MTLFEECQMNILLKFKDEINGKAGLWTNEIPLQSSFNGTDFIKILMWYLENMEIIKILSTK